MYLVSFEKYELINILLSSFILLISKVLIIKYWNEFSAYFKLKKYNNAQKVHERNTPRLGGALVIIIYYSLMVIFDLERNFFFLLYISFLPVLLVSIKEDLFQNTSSSLRLLAMFVSCLFYFIFNETNFPIINLPMLNIIHSNYFLLIIFFTFSTLVIINGTNIIDGMNGLLSFTILTQIISIIFISKSINDTEVYKISLLMIIPVLIFLLFNYPFGRIFIGDTGAYFFGFLISILIIKLFGNNPQLLSWSAVLILFYPSFELLFSFMRKIFFDKKNPLTADDLHLHTLVYKLGLQKNIKPNSANNMVVIFLSPFWISPFLVVKIFNDLNLILFTLFFLSSIYIIIYLILRNNLK